MSHQARDGAQIERAFNVLARPDLRACYDALRNDEDAPALFPYGGFGSSLSGDICPRRRVEGTLRWKERDTTTAGAKLPRQVRLVWPECPAQICSDGPYLRLSPARAVLPATG